MDRNPHRRPDQPRGAVRHRLREPGRRSPAQEEQPLNAGREDCTGGRAMQRARVNGIELEYEITGAGDPVLLISPVLADGFRPLVGERALTDRYQLITYHRRGWVGSTRTPPPVTMADHAADAAALLDYLKIGRAHIAGHSSGAAVAVQLALDHPQHVQTLALLELSLLSIPAAAGLLEKAKPAFAAYGEGRPAAALAAFMSAVRGLSWDA